MNIWGFISCILFGHKVNESEVDYLEIFNKEKLYTKCLKCETELVIYLDPENSDYYFTEEAE